MTHADTVFTGGHVFAGSATDTARSAVVAVREGSILAVGSADDVDSLIGPDTEVVGVAGGLIVPGFQDAHAHPIGAGIELMQCDLTGALNAEDCLRRIAVYSAEHPDEPWVLGAGWSMEFFPGGTPTAQALDAIVADRPVLLSNRDHHGAWVNTRALELAGITAATADPADGRIERDAHGAPTGTLHEGAVNLLDAVRPPVTAEQAQLGLQRAQTELFSLGITSWQDALVGTEPGMADSLETYLRAAVDGSLIARVTGALWWERDRGLEQLSGHIARRARVAESADSARLQMNTVKIMVDGVVENFTAAISSPYLDSHGHPTDNSGLSFIPPRELREYVVALDAAGFTVHFHALGDRAVTESLDALQAAHDANGPRERRHHLAHLQMIDRSDVPRFTALDAVANIQALWATHEPQIDELATPFLHPALGDRQYPFGDLDRAGVRFAAGSDWPVSSADPLAAIRVAVTRMTPNSSAPPLGGTEQAIGMATAFAAYTSGSAWVNGRDTITGRVVPGYRADLAVLDGDPFAGGPESLDSIRVSSTWVDGGRVYQA